MLDKPKGDLAGRALWGVAISDHTYQLRDRQCVVTAGGIPVTGMVVVVRYPCLLPEDAEVWEAVSPPAGMEWLPDDCVICTRNGKGICALSGGDHDGDCIAALQDPWLVDFFRATSTGLTNIAGAARVEVKAELQAIAVINDAQQGVVDPGAYRTTWQICKPRKSAVRLWRCMNESSTSYVV